MFKLYTVFFLIEMCSTHQAVFNVKKVKQYALINPPKLWFEYVEQFIELFILRRFAVLSSCKGFNIDQSCDMTCFKVSKQILGKLMIDKDSQYIECTMEKGSKGYMKDFLILFKGITKTMQKGHDPLFPTGSFSMASSQLFVLQPAGHTEGSGQYSQHDQRRYLYNNFGVRFKMHHQLRMNLTFHFLFVGRGNVHTCSIGSLKLKISSHIEVQFCGIMSKFVVFPENHILSLYWWFMSETSFQFLVFFSVIDANLLESGYQTEFTLSKFCVYLAQSKTSVSRITFLTEKSNIFVMNITSKTGVDLELYDGLEIDLILLPADGKLFHKTKYFCCVFYLWNISTNFENISDDIVKFYSTPNNNSNPVFVEANETYTLKFSSTATGVYIFKFETLHTGFCNLTLHSLSHNVMNDPGCFYFGLTSYSPTVNTSKELRTVCLKPKSFYKHRNIYSHKSQMLLVMYLQKENSHFKVNLTVSATLCRTISFNICPLQDHKISNRIDGKMQSVTDFIRIGYSGIETIIVSARDGICFTLQLAYDFKFGHDFHLCSCMLHTMRHSSLFVPGKVLTLNLSGFLREKRGLWPCFLTQ